MERGVPTPIGLNLNPIGGITVGPSNLMFHMIIEVEEWNFCINLDIIERLFYLSDWNLIRWILKLPRFHLAHFLGQLTKRSQWCYFGTVRELWYELSEKARNRETALQISWKSPNHNSPPSLFFHVYPPKCSENSAQFFQSYCRRPRERRGKAVYTVFVFTCVLVFVCVHDEEKQSWYHIPWQIMMIRFHHYLDDTNMKYQHK